MISILCSLPRSRFLGCHATLPQKKRLLTSELYSFLIVLAVCLRSFKQDNHFKMGLTDLRDSRCVCVVLIKAFLVLRLQACLYAIFLLYKRFFPLDQNVMRPLCLMVFVLIVRGNSQIYWMEGFLLIILSHCVCCSSVAFVKPYRFGLTARFQVALNKCYLWRHRIRGFLNSRINAYAIVSRCEKIAGCLFITDMSVQQILVFTKLIIVVSRFREL